MFKQNFKAGGRVILLLLIFVPLLISLLPVSPLVGQSSAAAKPIPFFDAATRTCPSGTAITLGDSNNAPTCYKSPPGSANDCPSFAKFTPGTSTGSVNENACISSGDNPTKQADCPKNSTFHSSNSTGSVSYGTCVFPNSSSSTPTATSCKKLGEGFQPATSGIDNNPASCVAPTPNSQKDCDKTNTLFTPSNGGAGSQNTCSPPSAAATSYCNGRSGKVVDCYIGYDTQDCSGLSGSDQATCQSAKNAATAGADTKTLSCAITNALNWIICPVVNLLTTAVNAIDNLITDELAIGTNGSTSNDQPSSIFCTPSSPSPQQCQDFHSAWSSFRNIALALMVLAGLVMVTSHALGMEILDAYTIRKTLPRLLIAAVAITLSWPLMQFFVTFSNDLGFGIRHLIYAPFVNINDQIHLTLGGSAAVELLGGGGFFAVGGGGMVLLFFAGTAALAVLIAILVLILRQILIILLIILAPIAIVAYILPNTQRIYKLWWDSFAMGLMMFPIIAGFIAVGRVFSAIAINSGTGTVSDVNQVVGFASYFAPYFLIPATFRFAGGAIRGIGGFVNDRSRGSFDRLRNARTNSMKTNREKLAAGTRVGGDKYEGGLLGQYSKFARTVNRGTRRTANLKNAGFNPTQMKARMSAAGATATDVAAREAREKNPALQALDGDDVLLRTALDASLENRGEPWIRQQLKEKGYGNIDQGAALIRAARNSGLTPEVFEQAAVPMLHGSKSGLTPEYQYNEDGSLYEDPETGQNVVLSGGAGESRELIAKAARGDGQRLIKILGQSREAAERAGRYDLVGGSYTEDVINTEAVAVPGGPRMTAQELTEWGQDGALDGMAVGRMMGSGHKRAVEALAKRMKVRTRQAAVVQGGKERKDQAAEAFSRFASLGAAVEAMTGSPPEVAAIFKEQVLDDAVDVASLPEQVRKEMLDSIYDIKTVREPVLRNRAVVFDPTTGKPEETVRQVKTLKKTMTNAEVKEGLEKNSQTYGQYKKTYTSGSEAYAATHGGAAPPEGPEGN